MAHPERRARPNVGADHGRSAPLGLRRLRQLQRRDPHAPPRPLGREGVILRPAYCPAPLCCPSRAAFASGRYGMNSGCFTNLHQPAGHALVRRPIPGGRLPHQGDRQDAHGDPRLRRRLHVRGAPGLHALPGVGGCVRGGRDDQGGDLVPVRGAPAPRGVLDDFLRFDRRWRYFMDGAAAGDPSFACHPWTLPEAHHLTAFVGPQRGRLARPLRPGRRTALLALRRLPGPALANNAAARLLGRTVPRRRRPPWLRPTRLPGCPTHVAATAP